MSKEQFITLSVRETSLTNEKKILLVETLKAHNGQLILEAKDCDSGDSPVVTAFYCDNKNPNIAITRLYLDKHEQLHADGIDQVTGDLETGLLVFDEHLSDMLWFAAKILGWTDNLNRDCFNTVGLINSDILGITSELAEKDIICKNNILPEEVYEGENIKEEYQDDFLSSLDKHQNNLQNLTGFDYHLLTEHFSDHESTIS